MRRLCARFDDDGVETQISDVWYLYVFLNSLFFVDFALCQTKEKLTFVYVYAKVWASIVVCVETTTVLWTS